MNLAPKPEEDELELKRHELHALQEGLVERELQLVSLKGVLAALERLYVKRVGVVYAELDEIEAQIAELLARREPRNAKVQGAAREARARAEDSRAAAGNLALAERPRSAPSASLKSLYREVAKRIHPDLAANEADRAKRQGLMAQANQAYGEGDEARLRAILEEYETSPDAVLGEGTGFDLIRVIRKIAQVKRRLAEIDAETEQIRGSDLFELKEKVDQGAKAGRDVLGEMAAAAFSRLGDRRAELRSQRERTSR